MHLTIVVARYWLMPLGARKDEVFLHLKALLEPFGITRYEFGLTVSPLSTPLQHLLVLVVLYRATLRKGI